MHIPWIFCACFLIWMVKECDSKKFYLLKIKGAKSTDQHLETSAEDNWKNGPAEAIPDQTDEGYLDEDWNSQELEYEEPKPKKTRNKSTQHCCTPEGNFFYTTDWEARGGKRPEGAPP